MSITIRKDSDDRHYDTDFDQPPRSGPRPATMEGMPIQGAPPDQITSNGSLTPR